jgi:endonuclease/exonuclease/phosphatase (EEP) superfamily protein YafD
MFDFTQGLVPSATEQELSFRMSDHFPLWVEFEV